MHLCLTATQDDDGRRLDRVLRKVLRKTPLSAIHRMLRKGLIRVDGLSSGAAYRVRAGQTITVPSLDPALPQQETLRRSLDYCLPQPALEILFEGEGLLILNKAAGLLVHGRGSLEEQVLSYLKLSPSLSFRSGPLHRLDRPTSGLLVFSTNLNGARFFSAMMRERKIKKQYLAIVEGIIKENEIWQDKLVRDKILKKTFVLQHGSFNAKPVLPDKAKTAMTRVRPLLSNTVSTLILAEIETGRIHQIRSQAASYGHPLLGDRKYGGAPFHGDMDYKESFLLHAWRMEFPSPLPRFIEAPLPEKFREKIYGYYGVDSVQFNAGV